MTSKATDTKRKDAMQRLADPERIIFKDADTLGEIIDLDSWTRDEAQAPPRFLLGGRRHRGGWPGQINPYISHDGYTLPNGRSYRPHAYGMLRPEVIERLRPSLFDDLTLNIHIHDHNNGYSLVCLDYSEIIGGFWLAYVRTDSIPA